MTDYNFMCDYESSGYINVNCKNSSTEMPNCNVSIHIISSLDQTYATLSSSTKPTSCTPQNCDIIDKSTLCIPAECGCTPITGNTKSEIMSVTMMNKHRTNNFSNSTIVAALGALVGLLLVLLATVSAVLAWTCWLLKKRNGIKFNTEYQLRYVRVHVRN